MPCVSRAVPARAAGLGTLGPVIYPIRRYGDPVLSSPAAPVADFTAVAALADAMFESMHEAEGIGLAAPQVGISLRFFVYDLAGFGKGVVCNPELVATGELSDHIEGCLSLPGLSGVTVARPGLVTVRGADEAGAPLLLSGEGLAAALLCHESDHLRGKLILDVAPKPERKRALREWRELALGAPAG